MNLFSSFLSVMTHVLRVLFLMLGWHVIWLPNGMEVNNKWSCCKKKKSNVEDGCSRTFGFESWLH